MAGHRRSRLWVVSWVGAVIVMGLLSAGLFAAGRFASIDAGSDADVGSDTARSNLAPARAVEQLEHLTALRAVDADGDAVDEGSAAPVRFPVHIRRPGGPPRIELTEPDPQGRTGSIACSTCHSVREPNFETRFPADLEQFHQGMPFNHGQLTCYACHHPGDADSLRLADSQPVSFPDVMKLCGQCHGIQMRDYEYGAHGGMTGYWDLTRGPRTRNNCIDCHDPHVPAFPKMQPVFKPQDRFLEPSAHVAPIHADGEHAATHPSETP